VIDRRRAAKTDLVIRAQHRGHVGRAVVMEGLVEILPRAGDVAEVDKHDAVSEAAGGGGNVFAHGEEVGLAVKLVALEAVEGEPFCGELVANGAQRMEMIRPR